MYSAITVGVSPLLRLHSQGLAQVSCETGQKRNFCVFRFVLKRLHLVEEAEELASNVLAASLLVVHDTGGGGQDDVTELTRGEQLGGPLLEVTELDGVTGVDNTTLVQAAVQLDDDLAGAVVVNLLELANVA